MALKAVGALTLSAIRTRFRSSFREYVRGGIKGYLDNFENDVSNLIERWFWEAYVLGFAGAGGQGSPESSIFWGNVYIDLESASKFAGDIRSGKYSSKGGLKEALDRVDLYVARLQYFFDLGFGLFTLDMRVWEIGGTEHHCEDCLRYQGQVHRYADWVKAGAIPKSHLLGCTGIACDCSLRPTTKPESGVLEGPRGR